MFNSFAPKILNFLKSNEENLYIQGSTTEQWCLAFSHLQEHFKEISNHFFIAKDLEDAEFARAVLKKMCKDYNVLFLPGADTSPYKGAIDLDSNASLRFKTLYNLLQHQHKNIVIATIDSLKLRCPPKNFFIDNSFSLSPSEIISPEELIEKLLNLGYQPNTSIEEPGNFARRGEIFDIFTLTDGPIRIHYFDEMIEEIKAVDESTLMTIKDKNLDRIDLIPTPQIFCNSKFVNELRANIPQFGPDQKEKFSARKDLLNELSDGVFKQNHTLLTPLFFNETDSVIDYFDNNIVFHVLNHLEVFREDEMYSSLLHEEFSDVKEDINSECIMPSPEKLFLSLSELLKYKRILTSPNKDKLELDVKIEDEIYFNLDSVNSFVNKSVDGFIQKNELLNFLPNFIETHFTSKNLPCYYFYTNKASKDKFKSVVHNEKIIFVNCPLSQGFFNEKDNALFLTEADFFSYRRSEKQKATNHEDLFAEQLSTLAIGDYLVHSTHGIGKYTGMQSMDAGSIKSDFLVIEFKDNDKIYLPVYKLNQIQKYAGGEQSVKVASLRNNAFNKAKEKAKASVKKLAFDLLKLQAERESANAFAFSPPDEYYKDFELAFPYQETIDQDNAINRVIKEMQEPKPMDHLVCGDVGFGKTEVAIRAAFKAVEDHKQVGVLVPTTILALQHYHSFKNRYKNFPVKIDYLSRFRSAKESKEILEKVESGEIDIIIGTHKILSDKLKFKDLGLLIIDEEQKFGVAHKEKLKRYKSSIDILTLTATPIPRTMQIAYMGLRSLSLIKTPPPKRQSIKSYLIHKDPQTLKKAVEYELNRGGQVFIVHNRVNDIEMLSAEIRELVPKAKIMIAHGQLPERELEKRVKQFFSGEYQILISTVIIESGLDVPNANTMIVNNADQYGLAQLHQLRGRIGRSDRKAYAYFVIPKNKKLTDIAQKRLKALISYADLGSGFDIASSDLEIRGAGNIIGAEQSGHIESIGLELYTQLLNEAISEIKGIKSQKSKNIEVSVPFSTYIPNAYIEDTATRLKYYKKLSNCKTLEEISDCHLEFENIYGPIPQELENLILTIKSRYYLENCGVKTLSATNSTVTIEFDQDIIKDNPDLSTKIFDIFIRKAQKSYKFSPDNKVLYDHKKQLTLQDIHDFCLETHNKINQE